MKLKFCLQNISHTTSWGLLQEHLEIAGGSNIFGNLKLISFHLGTSVLTSIVDSYWDFTLYIILLSRLGQLLTYLLFMSQENLVALENFSYFREWINLLHWQFDSIGLQCTVHMLRKFTYISRINFFFLQGASPLTNVKRKRGSWLRVCQKLYQAV